MVVVVFCFSFLYFIHLSFLEDNVWIIRPVIPVDVYTRSGPVVTVTVSTYPIRIKIKFKETWDKEKGTVISFHCTPIKRYCHLTEKGSLSCVFVGRKAREKAHRRRPQGTLECDRRDRLPPYHQNTFVFIIFDTTPNIVPVLNAETNYGREHIRYAMRKGKNECHFIYYKRLWSVL